MKSKLITTILLITLVFSLTACGKNSGDSQELSDTSDTQTEEQKEEEPGEVEDTETENEEPQQESEDGQDTQTPVQEPAAETATITVYYSNADATAFESSEVSIPSLSPEAVLGALVSQGALTADVAENSFTVNTVDGKASIELDLNSAFAAYVSNMGSTGEYYTVGALVNTFLDAYECEQIRITVDEEVLSTGHAEYPGYLARFE
ncbi:GerMN domain-containing protein [Lachnospiraceae bacterium DSM 108991]|uniref:GerMN domain-containing protein n=1 Tax=Claveliimonas monacensis TaxID=2779351 RepID=A0ABR9RK42_9FIRM|nr:GerMN domain-containing protein [Claveliimonas monacensis]MBE5062940.1 GerMN domain-containing protein [Claveliimonas monacensis]